MQIQFNVPVSLGKQCYGKGQHTVPADDAKGWFFDGLVAEGKAVILRYDVASEPKDDLPPIEIQLKPVEVQRKPRGRKPKSPK